MIKEKKELEQDVYVSLKNSYKKVLPLELRHNQKEKKEIFYKENASDLKFLESITSPSNLHLPKNSSGISYGSPFRQSFSYITDHINLLEDNKNEIKEIFIDLLFSKLSDEQNILIKDGKERHYISEKYFCGCIYDGLKLSEVSKEIFDKFPAGEGIYSDNQHNKIIQKVWEKIKKRIFKILKDPEILSLITKMQELKEEISELSLGY